MTYSAERLLDDIIDNHRTFLPGPKCGREDVIENLTRPVLVGGLTDEESELMLSALPRGTHALYLEPLDKGLSGSKVFQAQYEVQGRRSKPFVMKVGPSEKIARESVALSELVAFTIRGIPEPVFRAGSEWSLLVQEFASLSEHSDLQSLRNRVRMSEDGPALVTRVLSLDPPTDVGDGAAGGWGVVRRRIGRLSRGRGALK